MRLRDLLGLTFLFMALAVLIGTYPVWPIQQREVTSVHLDLLCKQNTLFSGTVWEQNLPLPEFKQSLSLLKDDLNMSAGRLCGNGFEIETLGCSVFGYHIEGSVDVNYPPPDASVWQICRQAARRKW